MRTAKCSSCGVLTVRARPEFARYVRAGLRGESETRGSCPASSVERALGDSSRGGMPRKGTDSRMMLSRSGAARDYCTFQSVRKSRTDALLLRAMIMQVFVKGRRDGVLDGCFYSMGRKSRSQPLSETGHAAAI